ncbi:MAG: hypothetical protein JSU04_04225 [Bdellovibrionales bacterium]|nr:hypothetical protein [Bdellovibrionales bacterium]
MSDFSETAPIEVKKALLFLIVTLGVILLRGVLDIWLLPNELTVVGDMTLRISNLVISLFALAVTIVFMRMRIYWARYLLAVFLVFGLPSVIKAFFTDVHGAKILAILDLAQIATEGYALYLIFMTKPAREWFES